ncbi:hypothetical protein PWR63_32185 [Paraburkholderia sp. A2WS-5]
MTISWYAPQRGVAGVGELAVANNRTKHRRVRVTEFEKRPA